MNFIRIKEGLVKAHTYLDMRVKEFPDTFEEPGPFRNISMQLSKQVMNHTNIGEIELASQDMGWNALMRMRRMDEDGQMMEELSNKSFVEHIIDTIEAHGNVQTDEHWQCFKDPITNNEGNQTYPVVEEWKPKEASEANYFAWTRAQQEEMEATRVRLLQRDNTFPHKLFFCSNNANLMEGQPMQFLPEPQMFPPTPAGAVAPADPTET